jgi:hypothetical protein
MRELRSIACFLQKSISSTLSKSVLHIQSEAPKASQREHGCCRQVALPDLHLHHNLKHTSAQFLSTNEILCASMQSVVASDISR